MKKQYLTNNENIKEDFQVYSTFSNQSFVEKIRTIEWSLGYMQKIEKYFAVNDLKDKTKPYYYVSMHINYIFEVKTENKLNLRKIEVSILGSETDFNNDELIKNKYKEYPITKKFSEYIKNVHKKRIDGIKKLSVVQNELRNKYPKKEYEIDNYDIKNIKESMNYINKMFENEKEITIIEDIGFNFYKGKYVEEGLEIYKNGNILREMEELRNELSINAKSTKKIIKKI